jgi:hypothetical protein
MEAGMAEDDRGKDGGLGRYLSSNGRNPLNQAANHALWRVIVYVMVTFGVPALITLVALQWTAEKELVRQLARSQADMNVRLYANESRVAVLESRTDNQHERLSVLESWRWRGRP